MPKSVELRLQGKELEVLETVRQHGVRSAMNLYGVRSRDRFTAWLKRHQGELKSNNPLAGLAGGEKHQWLVDHQETVLDLLQTFGRPWVMEVFCLEGHTLDEVVFRSISGNNPLRQTVSPKERREIEIRCALADIKELKTEVERAKVRNEIRHTEIVELRHRLTELEGAFNQFVPSVASSLGAKFTEAFSHVLETAIQPGGAFEAKAKPDPLNLDELIRQTKGSVIRSLVKG